ncbi:MAG: nucleotide exchange factor GrpE [Alkalispirochaeta sp.]
MSEHEKAGMVEADAETTAAGSSVGSAEDTVDEENTPEQNEPTGERTSPGDTSPDGEADGSDVMEKLKAQIETLEAENAELKNEYLRKQADMENFRKRMIRDRENTVQFSNQQILLDITSIIDDFERAIRSAEESRDFDSFHDGIVLIENQLIGMLERKWGLKRFGSDGEVFDPQKHEAVTTEPREDHSESIVLEDYRKGYMLHERVLRPAKVKVSMPVGNKE